MEEPRGDKSGPFVIFPRHRVASFRVPLAADATLLYHSGERELFTLSCAAFAIADISTVLYRLSFPPNSDLLT